MATEYKLIKEKLLFTKDKNKYIAWHHAACFGRLEALQTLWSWAKEVEVTSDELLLTKSWEGFTAFEMATERNHV